QMCKLALSHLVRIFCMIFKLFSEVTYSTGYRPCSGISERANSITLDLFCDTDQKVNVFHRTMTMLKTMQYFFHPSCTFTAWAALTAGFMVIKPCECPQISHNADCFIHNDKPAGSKHGSGGKTTFGKRLICHESGLTGCC